MRSIEIVQFFLFTISFQYDFNSVFSTIINKSNKKKWYFLAEKSGIFLWVLFIITSYSYKFSLSHASKYSMKHDYCTIVQFSIWNVYFSLYFVRTFSMWIVSLVRLFRNNLTFRMVAMLTQIRSHQYIFHHT